MALVSPQQVSDGTSIVASNVNNPINTIANDYNGNITDANISASAAISGSKIATASVPTTTLINDWQTNYVVSGGVIAISSGLIGTFSTAVVVIDGYKLTLSSVPNKTYTASKDTYVDILRTGTTPSIVYTEVANNAASPALASSSIRVGIVVTSGAAITSINQGDPKATLPLASSAAYAVCDSLGNLIYNTTPSPTIIGVRRNTSDQNGIVTSPSDIAGTNLTVLVPAGRKLRLAYSLAVSNNTGITNISIQEGATVHHVRQTFGNTTNSFSNSDFVDIAPSAGSHTYKLTISNNGGTSNMAGSFSATTLTASLV